MSMLREKRNELIAKLNALETARQAEIDAKVAEYRAIVDAQVSTEPIDNIKNVIAALDEVIAYENIEASMTESKKIVAEPMKESTMSGRGQAIESRPGMTTVFTPSRS